MASEFPAMLFYSNPESGYDVHLHTPLAAATFRPYALVVQTVDGGADHGKVGEVAADPTVIYGIAMAAAVDANSPYNGQVPVCKLNSTMIVGLAVVGTLAITHQGLNFGVAKSAAGNWKLDLAEVTTVVFHVTRVIIDRQIAIGHFLAAVLQGDAITDVDT